MEPSDPRASGGWGLRSQTPIGLRRLGSPPPEPQNNPSLRISGYAPEVSAHKRWAKTFFGGPKSGLNLSEDLFVWSLPNFGQENGMILSGIIFTNFLIFLAPPPPPLSKILRTQLSVCPGVRISTESLGPRTIGGSININLPYRILQPITTWWTRGPDYLLILARSYLSSKKKHRIKSFAILAEYTEACNEFAWPIYTSLRPGNAAAFEEISQPWRADGNTVFNLTRPRFEPQTLFQGRTRYRSTNWPSRTRKTNLKNE